MKREERKKRRTGKKRKEKGKEIHKKIVEIQITTAPI